MVEVSAGVIYDAGGRILICQRGEGRKNAHLWEFPGGKREAGESAAQCLVRELQEELALPVQDVREMCTGTEAGIRFTFLTAHTGASPVPTEHEAVRWVQPRELTDFTFCPADVPVARRLALKGICHFIWDFDGTLMDTYPAMVRAFVAGAADHGVCITPARTLDLMKNCLHHCCVTVAAESGVTEETLRSSFRRHEKLELLQGVALMDGMADALRALHARGGSHYVATHRDLVCRDLLEKAGVLGLFGGFVTQEDGLPRKPAPDMLQHLMARHGLQRGECMMIGDRPLDTEAGMAAGIMSVLIDPEGRFPEGRCHLRVKNVQELAAIFDGLM